MGMNYYLVTKQRPEIPRKIFFKLSEGIHIGKSSFGWCFCLHVYPEHRLNNFEDWRKLACSSKSNIYNEDGVLIKDKYNFLYNTISNRYWAGPKRHPTDYGYISYEDYLNKNNAEDGPRNLLRSRIDNIHCIGHGEGTYDYIVGEFS